MKRRWKMNKYGKITNLAELDAAEKKLRHRIRNKEKELSGRFDHLQQDYSPTNLFGMTVRTTGADAPLLEAVRWLRKKLGRL